MKILFIDNLQNIQTDFHNYSIGLLSLASVLNETYDVEIINFNYLFVTNRLNYDIKKTRNFETMADHIMSKKPDVVGFTAMCNSFHNSLVLSHLIKSRDTGIKIIFGGPQVSILPEKIMEEYGWIDLICTGEGDEKIAEIIKGLEENDLDRVPGIVYRNGKIIVRNKDIDMIMNLDELPMLNYDLIPYFQECSSIPIETGRGCPYNCIYCSTSKYWKHKFRVKSVERILKEILFIKSLLGEKKVNFEFLHDNFTTDYNFAMTLCEKLEELHIDWFCSARIDRLDEKLIKQMALGGCNEIYIGIESASPRIQKYINKNLALEHVEEVIDVILQNQIKPCVSFMYGFPQETEEDLNLTLNMLSSLLKKGVFDCQLHSLCVLNGTKLFEEEKDMLVLKEYYSDIADPSNFELCGLLIGKNKELFSHFYTLEGSLGDRYFLLDKFIRYILITLYKYFPRTINLIIKASENNILNFYNDFLSNSDNRFIDFFKNKEYIRDFIGNAELIEYMTTFLEGYINKKLIEPRFNIILNTFHMERTKFNLKYCLHIE